jgi:hypothetical protein
VKVFRGAPPTEIAAGEKSPLLEPPKVWLPVIPAERKRALLELHRAAAEAWTHDLRGTLRHGDQIRLSAFTFESASQLVAEQTAEASAWLFVVDGTRRAGCVLVGAPLTAHLARGGIEIKAAQTADTGGARLTRLETMIARRAIDRIVGHLSECYARAGESVH